MEALPDLASLSDAELKELIKQLEAEENEISFQRRLLHGKLDILRAELVARLQQKGEGELGQVDLDRLTDILAGKAAAARERVSHVYCPECGFQNLESAQLLRALRRDARHRGGAGRPDHDLLRRRDRGGRRTRSRARGRRAGARRPLGRRPHG